MSNVFNKIFKGKTYEEIKDLSLDQMKNYLGSRARRCINRGLTNDKHFLKVYKRIDTKLQNEKIHRTNYRNLLILPALVNKTIMVHNGKSYIKIEINQDMIGKKVGDFIPTKIKVKHSGKKGIGATKGSKTKAAAKT